MVLMLHFLVLSRQQVPEAFSSKAFSSVDPYANNHQIAHILLLTYAWHLMKQFSAKNITSWELLPMLISNKKPYANIPVRGTGCIYNLLSREQSTQPLTKSSQQLTCGGLQKHCDVIVAGGRYGCSGDSEELAVESALSPQEGGVIAHPLKRLGKIEYLVHSTSRPLFHQNRSSRPIKQVTRDCKIDDVQRRTLSCY